METHPDSRPAPAGTGRPCLDVPPEALADEQTIRWLIANADPELWAPRHFLIVDHKCGGDHHLIATWFAIYRLLVFYKPMGRRSFSHREIAAVGRVGRGHLSGPTGTLRRLADLGLISIEGHEQGRPIFRIDTDRLEAESIVLLRQRLSVGQLVPRRRPPAQRQLDMFRLLGLTPDEELLTLARGEGQQDDAAYLPVPALAAVGAGGAPLGAGVAPLGAGGGEAAPGGAPLGAGVAPLGAGGGEAAPGGAPLGAGVAPLGATRDRARERESEREERERGGFAAAPSAATRTPESLMWLIQQAIQQELPALVTATMSRIGQTTMAAGGGAAGAASPLLPDAVPPPPAADEPPLVRGLLSTWRIVSRQDPIPERDLAQLEVLVSRYTRATGGHAAYWLCRAMWEADRRHMHGGEPVTLRLINAYMQRLEQEGFCTTVLETPPAAKGARLAPPPAGPPPAGPAPGAMAGGLPPELAEHWVVTTWRRYAGADAVILPDRAQHLIATVQRREVWEAVLANWQGKYRRKANWTQWDGLLAWYRREAAAPVAGTADEYDPDGPPPSASVIDQHPGLDGRERGVWYQRFHAAGDSKAAKQAVIRQLLAEHPLACPAGPAGRTDGAV